MAEPRCPLCGKPRVARYRPFCSLRCSEIDLNRWLSGVYSIPAAPDDDDEAERGVPRNGEEGSA